MDQILYQWQINLTTWTYLSSLLTIAIYFKFSRLLSMRNLDLLALVALAPGLLLIDRGGEAVSYGYLWLLATAGFFLLRLLIDSGPMMVRRPLLEPNMTPGGLTFLGVWLLVFLNMNVLTRDPTDTDLEGARQLDKMLSNTESVDAQTLAFHGPGYPLLYWLPSISNKALAQTDDKIPEEVGRRMIQVATSRTLAILSHLAVVIGMVVIGVRHFDNIRTGIAAATLYLLLPYTAQMTGSIDHVLPAALLVWAVVYYRYPLVSGMLIGLATGVIYYPIFLLPLWVSFYWRKGLAKFCTGVACMLAILVGVLALTSADFASFVAMTGQMFGRSSLLLQGGEGFWALHPDWAAYRIPVIVAFVVLSISFAIVPGQKNLGTLISCSAAIMLATQFWHAQRGGMYMDWYLPLLLLTIFRPNLEDRVAVSVLRDSWFGWRRLPFRIRTAA